MDQPAQPMIDASDGGWTSRKLALSALAMFLITGLGAATARWPSLAGSYPTAVGGILGALATYCGAAAFHGKLMKDVTVSQGPDPEPEQPQK